MDAFREAVTGLSVPELRVEGIKERRPEREPQEEIRIRYIREYAEACGLAVTAYKDYGWDPIELPAENIDSFYSSGL